GTQVVVLGRHGNTLHEVLHLLLETAVYQRHIFLPASHILITSETTELHFPKQQFIDVKYAN
ncbi:hypothetical protein, partial [Pseudomonas helleri]|uniref:hypothetical protein n=1 Tax=Pseudomonas helleri TaxID=1608996 RepID=UPI001E2DED7C